VREAFAHRVAFALSVLLEQLDVASGIGRLDAHDLVPSSIAAAAFDEDDFDVVAELRSARDDRRDVVALVATRHDDARRQVLALAARPRSRHQIVPQAQFADEWQRRDHAVDQRADTEQPLGDQLSPFGAHRLEPRQLEQVGDVRRPQPVCQRFGHAQLEDFGQPQHRLPQIIVIGDDKARVGTAQRQQALERPLAIVEHADGIGDDDDVERTRQAGNRRGILGVADDEIERGMRRAGARDHRFRNIDADAFLGLQRREQPTGAAADLEHAQPFRNQES